MLSEKWDHDFTEEYTRHDHYRCKVDMFLWMEEIRTKLTGSFPLTDFFLLFFKLVLTIHYLCLEIKWKWGGTKKKAKRKKGRRDEKVIVKRRKLKGQTKGKESNSKKLWSPPRRHSPFEAQSCFAGVRCPLTSFFTTALMTTAPRRDRPSVLALFPPPPSWQAPHKILVQWKGVSVP